MPFPHNKQVDDGGKVHRLRKQCPQCGPGTFMATHFDRVYCGKCGTTFLYEQVSNEMSLGFDSCGQCPYLGNRVLVTRGCG